MLLPTPTAEWTAIDFYTEIDIVTTMANYCLLVFFIFSIIILNIGNGFEMRIRGSISAPPQLYSPSPPSVGKTDHKLESRKKRILGRSQIDTQRNRNIEVMERVVNDGLAKHIAK